MDFRFDRVFICDLPTPSAATPNISFPHRNNWEKLADSANNSRSPCILIVDTPLGGLIACRKME